MAFLFHRYNGTLCSPQRAAQSLRLRTGLVSPARVLYVLGLLCGLSPVSNMGRVCAPLSARSAGKSPTSSRSGATGGKRRGSADRKASRRRNAASDRKRSAADGEARKSGFPPLKSLQIYPQRPRSGAKCRRCGRPSGARKKGARTGLLPEGGRGGRAARANRADEAPKSRPAERRRRGRAKYGRWRFVRQRAQRRAWRHDAGKGKAARTWARLWPMRCVGQSKRLQASTVGGVSLGSAHGIL